MNVWLGFLYGYTYYYVECVCLSRTMTAHNVFMDWKCGDSGWHDYSVECRNEWMNGWRGVPAWDMPTTTKRMSSVARIVGDSPYSNDGGVFVNRREHVGLILFTVCWLQLDVRDGLAHSSSSLEWAHCCSFNGIGPEDLLPDFCCNWR